jgi:ABC-2 type transport system permease protein
VNPTYLLMELRSTVRNPRFLIFTLILPVALFLVFGHAGNGGTVDGIGAITYLMVGMALFGGMSAALSSGVRIAVERSIGWNRLLRLTPLRPATYVVAKAGLALLAALPAMLAVYGLGLLAMHVHLAARLWAEVALLSWVALVPFAVLGIVIGYVATADTAQPVTGTLFLVLSMLGGMWFPISQLPHGLQEIAHATPSYWLFQVARSSLAGGGLDRHAVVVLAAWTVGLAAVAVRRFRSATTRS